MGTVDGMTIRELIDACMTIGSEIGFDSDVLTLPCDASTSATIKTATKVTNYPLGGEAILLK